MQDELEQYILYRINKVGEKALNLLGFYNDVYLYNATIAIWTKQFYEQKVKNI